jgi:flagellar basal body rod protein FlgG
MNYGLWISAMGMSTGMYRMDVAANNLANIETTGFKADIAATKQREAPAVEDNLSLPSDKLLEKLGGGIHLSRNRIALSQGALERTGQAFDVAINGPGFLAVNSGTGSADIKLSRDGRLTINNSGTLVQASSGLPVLDDRDSTITIDPRKPGKITIDENGRIFQGTDPIARLQVTTVSDPTRLTKFGQGLFSAPEELMNTRTQLGRDNISAGIVQGSIERSSVDPVRAMLDINAAERSVSTSARIIQTIDESMQKAINTFGRLA